MAKTSVKYCFIAECKNNSITCPEKEFLFVPVTNRAEWCRAAGLKGTSKSHNLFICEDHLNLKEDMENYTYWKTMKAITKVNARLKPRVPIFRRPLQERSNSSQDLDSSQPTTINLPLKLQSQGVMCSPDVANKMTQIKVKMSDCPTQCSIQLKKIIHQKPSPLSISPVFVPSNYGSTTEITEFDSTSETSSPGIENQLLIGREFMMSIIKKTNELFGPPF